MPICSFAAFPDSAFDLIVARSDIASCLEFQVDALAILSSENVPEVILLALNSGISSALKYVELVIKPFAS